MSYYRTHLFFCTNQRPGGEKCCQNADASAMRAYAKDQIKALGLDGKGGVRVNVAGCLGRCPLGPVAVVYPEAIWYTYRSKDDVDEIIQSHLREGKPVERLQIKETS